MEKKNWTWLWILLAVVSILLSCALGAVAGGISGYMIAKKVSQPSGQVIVPTPPRLQQVPFQTPAPVPTPKPPARQTRLAAMVVNIVPNGPAEDAGLRLGDMIYAVDDQVITQERDLAALIGQYRPGDEITLYILRRGERKEISVRLGENPNKPGKVPWLGIEYRLVGAAIGLQED